MPMAKLQGKPDAPALLALGMKELDKLELDVKSQEGLSRVAVSTPLVPPSPQIV